MKQITSSVLILFLLLAFPQVFVAAATNVSPTVQPTPTEIADDRLEKIKALKERVATKVAQLKKKETSVVGGEIKERDENSVTIARGETELLRVYIVPETIVASISGENRTKLPQNKLEVGQSIAVMGVPGQKEYTLDSLAILVNLTLPVLLTGKISAVDTADGSFTLVRKGNSLTVDVEKTTKTRSYSPNDKKLTSTGLSKLHIGDFVHVTGETASSAERVSALRILNIPFQGATTIPAQVNTDTSPTLRSTPSKAPRPSPTKTKSSPSPIVTP